MQYIFLSKNFDIFPDNGFVVVLILIYLLLLVLCSLSCLWITILGLLKQDKSYQSAFLKWLCGAIVLWTPLCVLTPELLWIPFKVLFILTMVNLYLYRRSKSQEATEKG